MQTSMICFKDIVLYVSRNKSFIKSKDIYEDIILIFVFRIIDINESVPVHVYLQKGVLTFNILALHLCYCL